jgi:DNA end-binding protein Ku
VEDRSIGFHLLDARDGARIRYRKVNERSGEEVDGQHIVRGYPVGPSQHVTFSDEELERIPADSAGQIDVAQFVTPDEIDPALFDRSYFVAPRESGGRAYVVLREAMRGRGLLAVAKLTMRQRERLAAIRADDTVLVLETLHWPDEIRIPDFEVGDASVAADDQVAMAGELIEHLRSSFEPARYRDTYRERLEEAIESRLAGKEIELAPDQPEAAEVVDLMEVLRRSVEETRLTA